eukprot:gene43851-63595_t
MATVAPPHAAARGGTCTRLDASRSGTRGGYDVAVVGAGMVGTAAAYHLSQQGHRVVLIGPDPADGWSASADVSRVATAANAHAGHRAEAAASLRGVADVPPHTIMMVCHTVGGRTIFRDAGVLSLQEAAAAARTAAAAPPGATTAELVPPGALGRLHPYLSPSGDFAGEWAGHCAAHAGLAMASGCARERGWAVGLEARGGGGN